MKKYFITGFVTLLPLVLTAMIALFVVNILTKPFQGLIEGILHYSRIFNDGFFIFNNQQVVRFFSQILALAFFFAAVFLVGFLGSRFILNYFFGLVDQLFHQIPLINRIYKACKDVVTNLFQTQKKGFGQVVLVPFPYQGLLVLGFVTDDVHFSLKGNSDNLVSVFIPATPNPTMGFILLYKKEEVMKIDMKPEEAFKSLISCGAMLGDFSLPKSP